MGLKTYKPNPQEIIWQMIDGECILLNMSNGNYFSLDNLGVLIWQSVVHSVPEELLIDALFDILPDERKGLIDSVKAVFEALVQEGLAVPANEFASDTAGFIAEIRSQIGEGSVVLQPAKLHAYKNIQEKYAHPCGVKEI